MEVNEKGRSIKFLTNLAALNNKLFNEKKTVANIDALNDTGIYNLLKKVKEAGKYTNGDLELLLVHEPITTINL